MKYMGSKVRFIKQILPIILKDRSEQQCYVEPFAGGMNSIAPVTGYRIANDNNEYLIAMWNALLSGWVPPVVEKEVYNSVKMYKELYSPELVGWVGFNCSYSGKWFAGFAGKTKTKIGTVRDYQAEALRNVQGQCSLLKGVVFSCCSYDTLLLPPNSIIYCDPPYYGTTSYNNITFDYDAFWEWCRNKSKDGHSVFVSEYNAPDDFECLWQSVATSSLSANGRYGRSKISVEKLFRYKG